MRLGTLVCLLSACLTVPVSMASAQDTTHVEGDSMPTVAPDSVTSRDTASTPSPSAKPDAAPSGGTGAATGKSESSPFQLNIGIELSSANGFDQAKVTPALGFSVAGATVLLHGKSKDKVKGSKTPVAPKVTSDDRPILFTTEVLVSASLTQAANVRRHRSCRVLDVTDPPTTGAIPDGPICEGDRQVDGRTLRTVFLLDSTAFRPVSVWRAFLQGRLERAVQSTLRIGPILGVGIQSNPNSLGDPSQQRLKPLGAVGLGFRSLASSDNTEYFSLDVVYGAVQNYAQDDVFQPAVADREQSVVTVPLPVRRTSQWQVTASLRPTKSFRIRAMATLSAPPPDNPLEPPVPDIARIAFMTDRDLADIVTALLGGEKRPEDKDKTSPDESWRSRVSRRVGLRRLTVSRMPMRTLRLTARHLRSDSQQRRRNVVRSGPSSTGNAEAIIRRGGQGARRSRRGRSLPRHASRMSPASPRSCLTTPPPTAAETAHSREAAPRSGPPAAVARRPWTEST